MVPENIINLVNQLCQNYVEASASNQRTIRENKYKIRFIGAGITLSLLIPCLFLILASEMSSFQVVFGIGIIINTLSLMINGIVAIEKHYSNIVFDRTLYTILDEIGKIVIQISAIPERPNVRQVPTEMNSQTFILRYHWNNKIEPIINMTNCNEYFCNNLPMDSITNEEIVSLYAYTLDDCSNDFISLSTLEKLYKPGTLEENEHKTVNNPFTNLPLSHVTKWKINRTTSSTEGPNFSVSDSDE